MKVKYVGPHTEGVIIDSLGIEAKPGDIVEVPDDAALGADWEPVEAKKSKAAAAEKDGE
jgi:hypothetical protein